MLLLYVAPRFAYDVHPLLGIASAIVLIVGSIAPFGIALKRRNFDWLVLLFGARPSPIARFLLTLWLVWVAAISGFSLTSFGLYDAGYIGYNSSEPILAGDLADYYAWHLLDMIPGFEIWATLQVGEPIQAAGLGASFLLLIFRIYVVVVFFGLIKTWVDLRKRKTFLRRNVRIAT